MARVCKTRGVRGFVLALCVALLIPTASAGAAHHKPKPFKWGSSLKPSPTQTIPGTYAADAEFWPTALGSSTATGVTHAFKAPRSGRILSVKLKTGNDS